MLEPSIVGFLIYVKILECDKVEMREDAITDLLLLVDFASVGEF